MRWITAVIAALLVLIQYPLWLGDGGWFKVWEREKKLAVQQKTNEELRARNAAMEGEVRDLRSGTAAIEERARYELGMIKNDEIFVQVVDKPPAGTQ
jgi:cell division protein FtsB